MNRIRVFCTALGFLVLLAPQVVALVDLRDGIGTTVAEIGDVDRDGTPDVCLLLRARGLLRGRSASDFAEVERAPLVPHLAILSGASGEMLRIFPAFDKEGVYTSLVCGVGDINGDQRAEAVVSGGGVVRCFDTLTAKLLWEAGRELKRSRFGWNLLRVPDASEDGVDDLLSYCGPSRLRGHDQALYLISGSDGRLLRCLSGQAPRARSFAADISFTPLTLTSESSRDSRNLAPCRALAPHRDAQGRATGAISFLVRWPSPRRSQPEVFERWRLQPSSFEIEQEELLPFKPWAMASLGSVDSDEHPDYAYTARGEWLKVFSRGPGTELFSHDFAGGQTNGEGTQVLSLLDLNGDGFREVLMSANEEVEDCDGGSVRVLSGADGSVLWHLDFQGENGIDVGPCGIGVDACVFPWSEEEGREDVICHLPRLREARRLNGRTGSVLWRWAYDVQENEVIEARPRANLSGKLMATQR